MKLDLLKAHCDRNSKIVSELVDNFLLDFVEKKEKIASKFEKRMQKFRKHTRNFPKEWMGGLTAEYMVFRLFKKNGLISKYQSHPIIQSRSEDELEVVNTIMKTPAQLSLCMVEKCVGPEFFDMEDLGTGERFTLYSPGIQDFIDSWGKAPLLFILRLFNGECWQTYGILNYFKGFQPYDFIYFAKMIDRELVNPEEVDGVMSRDPGAFFMLAKGAEIPSIASVKGNYLVVRCCSTYKKPVFVPEHYEKDFKIEKKGPVTHMMLKRWYKWPHFAEAFYDSKKKQLILQSMTERGFERMIEKLAPADLDPEPQYRATENMVNIAEELLGRNPFAHDSGKLFEKPEMPKSDETFLNVNGFVEKVMDYVKNDQSFNVEMLAKDNGLEIELAWELISQIQNMLGEEES